MSQNIATDCLFFSSYPDKREKEDDNGVKMGVVGSVSLLQNMTIASQPISSMDWSPDKVPGWASLSM